MQVTEKQIDYNQVLKQKFLMIASGWGNRASSGVGWGADLVLGEPLEMEVFSMLFHDFNG